MRFKKQPKDLVGIARYMQNSLARHDLTIEMETKTRQSTSHQEELSWFAIAKGWSWRWNRFVILKEKTQ